LIDIVYDERYALPPILAQNPLNALTQHASIPTVTSE